jgi:hypothetical protein
MHAMRLRGTHREHLEAYVDDIVVKSKKTGDLVPDLTEVFTKA